MQPGAQRSLVRDHGTLPIASRQKTLKCRYVRIDRPTHLLVLELEHGELQASHATQEVTQILAGRNRIRVIPEQKRQLIPRHPIVLAGQKRQQQKAFVRKERNAVRLEVQLGRPEQLHGGDHCAAHANSFGQKRFGNFGTHREMEGNRNVRIGLKLGLNESSLRGRTQGSPLRKTQFFCRGAAHCALARTSMWNPCFSSSDFAFTLGN
jgi:hypothetical protein